LTSAESRTIRASCGTSADQCSPRRCHAATPIRGGLASGTTNVRSMAGAVQSSERVCTQGGCGMHGCCRHTSSVDRIWDVFLLFAGVAFAALGIANPSTAPVWVALIFGVALVALLHWRRGWIGTRLVSLGVRIGGADAVKPHLPTAEPSQVTLDPVITAAQTHIREEKRNAIRTVQQALRDAMTQAEYDRDRGSDENQRTAIEAANVASTAAHEVDNADARQLVQEWKAQFDSIRKGWKEGSDGSFGYAAKPPGYPEPAWTELRTAAEIAQDVLGVELRSLQS